MLDERVLERELQNRAGPVLSDGTPFRSLIDLEKREVSLRLLSDPEIYQLELERIFSKSWLLLGHESEIPNPGDFMMRKMGEDSVIVTRATDGSVNVLMNVCDHRGMEVVFADRGNTPTFKCPYHAWVYDGTGRLVGVPFEKEFYPEGWNKADYGLARVRMELRHGIIWANLSDTAPSFEDFLGPNMLYYIDTLFGTNEWVAVPNGNARRVQRANWKANMDQTHGDFLHAAFLHKSLEEIEVFGEAFGQYTIKVDCQPHIMFVFEGIFVKDEATMRARNALPITERGLNNLIFPTSVAAVVPIPQADGSILRLANLGSHTLAGPNSFEFLGRQVMLMPKGTDPEALAPMRRMLGNGSPNTGGTMMEDYDAWRSITTSSKGERSRKLTMKYPGIGGPSKTPEEWPGPGIVYDGISRDDTQWAGWLHYFDVMTSED